MKRFLSLSIREKDFLFLRGFRKKKYIVIDEQKTYPLDKLDTIFSKKEDVYVNYSSSFSYFDIQNVPKASKKVLPFYLRRKIDDMGIMKEREDFFINYRIIEETGEILKLAYFAALRKEKEKIFHALQSKFRILKLFTLKMCAVASLLSHLTKEANVAVFKDGEETSIIFNKDGVIYHVHTLRTKATDTELQSAIRYFGENFHEKLKMCFLIGEDVQGEYNISIPICTPFFGSLVKGINNKDANNSASNLGNLFVIDKDNLLPEQYLGLTRNLSLSKGISVCFFTLSFVFFILAISNLRAIHNLKNDYAKKYIAVEKEIDYVDRVRPAEGEIEKLNSFSNLYKTFLNEPKVTTTMVWFCKNVPPNIKFTNTEMKMENGNLNISIKGTISGNYERAKQSFVFLLNEMDSCFILQDKIFNYEDVKGSFSIKCVCRGNYESF